jgi:hypothetical protein
MFKKFIDGLVFGGGFAISFILLWYLAAYLIAPMFIESQYSELSSKELSELKADIQKSAPSSINKHKVPFHELGPDELIKQSSVIALVEFEPSANGKMKAIIKEFLKKEPGTTIYLNIGDEHRPSSYYPRKDTIYGDGAIIFFSGSPANYQRASYYFDGRIRTFGDMPLELFRKKCNELNARKTKVPFHELDVDEQIKQASVIALAKFELSPSGKYKTIISDFIKKEPDTIIYYKIGDEHETGSHNQDEHSMYGDGMIIFFTGSPAKYRMSIAFGEGRIPNYKDMPLDQFMKKCKENA